MSQYILIHRIQVQNANAIAGFTWGFPAITHFLGYTENLSRKLKVQNAFKDIILAGCAVISHKQKVHTYKPYDYQFLQSRNPPYLKSHDKEELPPIIEEGKMNMTVSLLIGCAGNIGNRQDDFIHWLETVCVQQRLAGGTILKIAGIEIIDTENINQFRSLKRKLLPGFLLMDRSIYLEKHFKTLQQQQPDVELLDAWMDFIAIKQKARPKSYLIHQHLDSLFEASPDNQEYQMLMNSWLQHNEQPYQEDNVPDNLKTYFDQLPANKVNKELINQWQSYCSPTEKTEADWEYVKKPERGFLVPIMIGYKAISRLYDNAEVAGTRDSETPVCFVESVHSIGEWFSVHRLKTIEALKNCLWHYCYERHWYLCQQYGINESMKPVEAEESPHLENPNNDQSIAY